VKKLDKKKGRGAGKNRPMVQKTTNFEAQEGITGGKRKSQSFLSKEKKRREEKKERRKRESRRG